MATQNPNENPLNTNDDFDTEELDQTDALRRAILKLKESGMLTHVPDDLGDIDPAMLELVADDPDPEPEPQDVSAPPPPRKPQPDDQTIPSRPKAESPTIASTDDIEQHADERAKWAAVMSGWGDELDEASAVPEPSSAPPTIPSRDQLDQPIAENVTTDNAWDLPTEQPEEPSTSIEEQAAITLRRKEIKPETEPDATTALTESREETPWILQQFFDGEIDLEQELLTRHQTAPVMTTFKTRTLGMNSSREVATLATQDGNAKIIIDGDMSSKVIQLSFNYGSMMTLRFVLRDIPANNRERWLDLMRRDEGGLAKLWNESRWRDDYLICITHDYTTNIFAFSPRNFESSVRLTRDTTIKLLDWLEKIWTSEPEPEDDDDSPLLTW